MNYQIAIVGRKDEILGFKGLGLKIYDAENQDAVEEILFDLKKKTEAEHGTDKYAIVFVLEEFIQNMEREQYERLSKGALPAIIPIPGHKGETGFGEEKIKRIVEKAVGSDIFG